MADANAEVAATPTDYVRIKRKKTTIFISMEAKLDTVHDLRARINHITKVPTTDVRFFIDKDGEIPLDENKCLEDQKVSLLRRHSTLAASLRTMLPLGSSACGPPLTHSLPPRAQIANDDVLYMVYRKEGSEDWEDIELAPADGAAPKAE